MAEPPVAFLLEQLEELVRLRGFSSEFSELSYSLEGLEDLLLDASERQFTLEGRESAGQWVDKLKGLCYEVDGVLAQWRSETLLKEAPLSSRKVCFCVPLSVFRRRIQSSPVVVTAKEIRELNERVKESAKYFRCSSKSVEGRSRTNPITDSEVYGREGIIESLMEKLLSESSQSSVKSNYVIPIVGMVGVGKTTLAQLAYASYGVVKQFDRRIWVHVGQPFDLIEIAKAIIERLAGRIPDLVELESLFRCVEEAIEGLRFLLILDDVWNEDEMKWLQLKGSLRLGAAGSRIVVTTRNKNVATMMGGEDNMIQLDVLSDKICWLIFSGKAFGVRDREECMQFEEIGRKIVMRCEGLPLFAQIFGDFLQGETSIEQWGNVLHSEIWDLDIVSRCLHPFVLSYYDLSALERRCLSYSSIFPKDYDIDRADLIELWMAQSYLTGNRYLEIGESCCNSLVMRSIFQGFANDFDGNATKFKMHALMRSFLQFLVRKECLIWDFSDPQEDIDQDNEITRHYTLLPRVEARIPMSVFSKKNLRTLFIVGGVCLTPLDLDHLLPKLSCLKTLCLYGCIEKLPTRIDKLVHLHYLNLTGNSNLEELPNGLCNLLNLQTLRLINCIGLHRLPENIGSLKNLHHLYIDGCHHLRELPKGIGRLTKLRILDMFVVPSDDRYIHNNRMMKLGDLNELKNLQGQKLHIRNCGSLDMDDAENSQLKSKEYLVELHLSFGENDEDQLRLNDGEDKLLQALEPHPNLISLLISNFHGLVFPVWMSSVLINLKRLQLVSCTNCASLPPLGSLPSLESLKIEAMKEVKKVGFEVLGIDTSYEACGIVRFPKLRELRFCNMPKWEIWEWSIGSGKEVYSLSDQMPYLESLEILRCPILVELPTFLVKRMQTRTMVIEGCKMLEELRQKKTEEKEVHVLKFFEKEPPRPTLIIKDRKTHGEDDSKSKEIKKEVEDWSKMFDLTQLIQCILQHGPEQILEEFMHRKPAKLWRPDYTDGAFRSTIQKFQKKRKEKWAR